MTSITLHPDYIFSVFGLPITNTFFTSCLVTGLLSLVAAYYYDYHGKKSAGPVRMIRIAIIECFRLIDSITGNRALTKKIFPLIATFFLFILTANLLALLPGFLGAFYITTPDGNIPLLRSPNSDLTTTVALALVSVFGIQDFSWHALGSTVFVERFINLSSPIAFFMGVLELLSELVKILSFSFRLFGNIFAGEVLLIVTGFLTPYFLPLPFMILEVFVGFIQAFIFAVLTLTFIKTSTLKHLQTVKRAPVLGGLNI